MFEMAKYSIILFFQGRLFKDNARAYRQMTSCAIVTAIILTVVYYLLCSSGYADRAIWYASAIGGFCGGLIQPYLFKDLKYA
jgi:hypothetical protein